MLPRDIQPDGIHLVHRRVAKGKEFLRKCAKTRAILAHALFDAATWYGIALHSVAFLEGEYFLALDDPHALLPLFMQRFNHTTAMSLNALHGVKGVFWEPGRSYDDTVLDNREDLIRALAFVHSGQKSNPQRARGRTHVNGWDFWDKVGFVDRPDGCWGNGDPVTDAKLVVPAILADEEPEQLKQQIQELAREHHWPPPRPSRKQRRARRRGNESNEPRFRLTPVAERRRVAVRDRFQHAYRKAWKRLQREITSLFPLGTWWLAFHSIVRTTPG